MIDGDLIGAIGSHQREWSHISGSFTLVINSVMCTTSSYHSKLTRVNFTRLCFFTSNKYFNQKYSLWTATDLPLRENRRVVDGSLDYELEQSLFSSWSIEQNKRDKQMTTLVTHGARRPRARALPPPLNPQLNLTKKRDCSQSNGSPLLIVCVDHVIFPELCEKWFWGEETPVHWLSTEKWLST